MPRDEVDLTGLWRFQPDPYDEGEGAGYPDAVYEAGAWREVMVPCSFDDCHAGLAGYEGAGWFRREFAAPKHAEGRRAVLRFEGVNYHARVWVNGHPVGGHEDPFLPFELPVHDVLNSDGMNSVTVLVDNVRRAGEVPGLERGWRPFGGILRRVSLVVTDLVHIAGVETVAEPEGSAGRLSVRARVRNGGGTAVDARATAVVGEPAEAPLARMDLGSATIPAGGEAEFRAEAAVEGALPWSPDSPALYRVRVGVDVRGQRRDEVGVRVGFRRIEVRGASLLLNGQPVFLIGFNRHEDSPRTGPCPDPATARADLADMKRMACNFVRLCHYPHDPAELDLCDEMGLLAMGEIPLYWWKGAEEGDDCRAAKLAAARRQLHKMIERDRNHPSVVLWSVSNETDERRQEVRDGNAQLVRLAKALDPSRPATHVSMHWWRGPYCDFGADDLISVNAYPSWGGHAAGAEAPDPARFGEWWRVELEKLHGLHPGKPILVSEFGRPGLEGIATGALGEDAQADVIAAEFASMDAPYLCGATIWCYADHPWPEEPFINRITTSPFGVVTRERRRLKAHAVVSRLFRERRGLAGPSARESREAPAGTPVTMIRQDMEAVPRHQFPEGFSIRPMRPGEGAVWTDIQRDAEPYFTIDDGLFEEEFGRDVRATEWRSFFIVDARGVAVGTISAWYERSADGDWGLIHWVAVRPAYQGRGLAKAAMTHAMDRLAGWHRRAKLRTQTRRIAAIKIYLDFGFVPDLSGPGARQAWRGVRSELDHPVLKKLDL